PGTHRKCRKQHDASHQVGKTQYTERRILGVSIVEAIVLGGGRNTGSLKEVDPTPYEAGIRINNGPMVEYVIEALEGMEEIKRILVVIPPGITSPRKWAKVKIVAPGESMIDSLIRAGQHTETDDHILVVASDIPFITKEAIRDF